MKLRIAQAAVTFLLIASWLLAGPVYAQSAYLPAPGVLVLRSGQTLSGKIARQGDSYHLEIAEGSEVRIPTSEVRLHSTSLEEAYQTQRATLAWNDLAGRLQLASWCLQAEMPHRAADQILVIRLHDTQYKGLAEVERRLAAFEMARRAVLATEAEAEQTAMASAAANPYDTSELEAAVANLSPELVETFAQRVQPLLVNRCGASGCHGYGSKTEFQVHRPSFHSTFTQRYTQRNLVAALQQLDLIQPEKSPLLERAMAVHGGEKAPALLDRRNQQNELLAEWIRGVASEKKGNPPQKAPAVDVPPGMIKAAAKQLLPPARSASKQSTEPSEVQAASFEEEDPAEATPAAPPASSNPVDPAAFNRRFHGRP